MMINSIWSKYIKTEFQSSSGNLLRTTDISKTILNEAVISDLWWELELEISSAQGKVQASLACPNINKLYSFAFESDKTEDWDRDFTEETRNIVSTEVK